MPGPSNASVPVPVCVGYSGKGSRYCCAPRSLTLDDFKHRNGSIKRACIFCRDKNKYRRSSAKQELLKKMHEQQQATLPLPKYAPFHHLPHCVTADQIALAMQFDCE
jgi:hypothetical protein